MKRFSGAFVALALLLMPSFVEACGSCYGDPGSGLTRGAKAAILFMIALIGSILFTIARLAWVWKKRAEALEQGTA